MLLPNPPYKPTTVLKDIVYALTEEKKATISGRAIGSIIFDVVTEENHVSSLKVTQNPIEDGSVIADHAVLDPKQLTIIGTVVNYEPNKRVAAKPSSKSRRNQLLRAGVDFLDAVVPPVKLPGKISTEDMQRNIADKLSAFSPIVAKNPRPIGDVLADIVKIFRKQDKTPPLSRVAQAYADLLACQKSGIPVTVQTGLCAYDNMVITSIAIPQKQDGSGIFTITLREVVIVKTAKYESESSSPSGENSSGIKGSVQKATISQMGKTNLVPTKKNYLKK